MVSAARIAVGLVAASAFGCSLLDWNGLNRAGSANDGAGGDGAIAADGSSGDGAGDGGDDAGARCDPNAAFDAPVLLPGSINGSNDNEIDGFLTADEMTLYFARDHGDGATYDIYVAKRAIAGGPFGAPSEVTELSSTKADRAPFLSRDGLTMYLTSDRTGNERIYAATRGDAGASFGSPQPITAFDAVSKGVGDPFFLPDDVTLYFTDDYDEVPMTARAASGSFTAPTAIPGLPGPAHAPKVTGDDRLVFYTAAGTAGESDIFMARRTAPGEPFAAGTRVDPLSSVARDALTWISADGCHALVTSARGNSMDLYFASRGGGNK